MKLNPFEFERGKGRKRPHHPCPEEQHQGVPRRTPRQESEDERTEDIDRQGGNGHGGRAFFIDGLRGRKPGNGSDKAACTDEQKG